MCRCRPWHLHFSHQRVESLRAQCARQLNKHEDRAYLTPETDFCMTSFVLSQILAGIAIIFDLLSFQFKERRKIVACLMISCLLISSHFVLLGYYTAAGLAIVAAVRFFSGLFSTSKRLMSVFILASIIISVVTYSGILSILSGMGSIFGTTGTFCKNDKRLRELILVGTVLWLIHNILAKSPTAVLMECLFIGSNLVGYYRFYIRPKKLALS
jgi:hypothetical protein